MRRVDNHNPPPQQYRRRRNTNRPTKDPEKKTMLVRTHSGDPVRALFSFFTLATCCAPSVPPLLALLALPPPLRARNKHHEFLHRQTRPPFGFYPSRTVLGILRAPPWKMVPPFGPRLISKARDSFQRSEGKQTPAVRPPIGCCACSPKRCGRGIGSFHVSGLCQSGFYRLRAGATHPNKPFSQRQDSRLSVEPTGYPKAQRRLPSSPGRFQDTTQPPSPAGWAVGAKHKRGKGRGKSSRTPPGLALFG